MLHYEGERGATRSRGRGPCTAASRAAASRARERRSRASRTSSRGSRRQTRTRTRRARPRQRQRRWAPRARPRSWRPSARSGWCLKRLRARDGPRLMTGGSGCAGPRAAHQYLPISPHISPHLVPVKRYLGRTRAKKATGQAAAARTALEKQAATRKEKATQVRQKRER